MTSYQLLNRLPPKDKIIFIVNVGPENLDKAKLFVETCGYTNPKLIILCNGYHNKWPKIVLKLGTYKPYQYNYSYLDSFNILNDGDYVCSLIYYIIDHYNNDKSLQTTIHNYHLINKFKQFKNSYFNIIAFDNTLKTVGKDLYELLFNNGMTQYLNTYVSYKLSNMTTSLTHRNKHDINENNLIPYGEYVFKINDLQYFIKYIAEQVNNQNINDQLNIANQLVNTLIYLTKNKSRIEYNYTIYKFAKLFKINTELMIELFHESIKREKQNTSILLDDLYDAHDEFYKLYDAKKISYRGAIGNFISFVSNNMIITGSMQFIDEQIYKNKMTYDNCSYMSIPIFCDNIDDFHTFQLLNWARINYSEMYKVGELSDELIVIVLLDMLRVCCNNIPDSIKIAYIKLAGILFRCREPSLYIRLLNKKMNFLPHNIDQEELKTNLTKNMSLMNIIGSPISAWKAICQLITEDCRKPVTFPDEIKVPTIKVYEITRETAPTLNYVCYLTKKDISNDGGFKMLPHYDNLGEICEPIELLSIESYNEFLNNKNYCPRCGRQLYAGNLAYIGPQKPLVLPN